MNDKWLNEEIRICEQVDFSDSVTLPRIELLSHLRELRRLRELGSLAQPQSLPCACTAMPKKSKDGRCVYCLEKVEVKS